MVNAPRKKTGAMVLDAASRCSAEDASTATAMDVGASGSLQRVRDFASGSRCWRILERWSRAGRARQRRVLVELGEELPSGEGCYYRVINSNRVYDAPWSDLEPLTEADHDSLRQLEVLGVRMESELAATFAALAAKGCKLGDVRWSRTRGGELTGERKDAAPKPTLGCSKWVVRNDKKCATPGCAFFDFHAGPCSHELELAPRKRRRS